MDIVIDESPSNDGLTIVRGKIGKLVDLEVVTLRGGKGEVIGYYVKNQNPGGKVLGWLFNDGGKGVAVIGRAGESTEGKKKIPLYRHEGSQEVIGYFGVTKNIFEKGEKTDAFVFQYEVRDGRDNLVGTSKDFIPLKNDNDEWVPYRSDYTKAVVQADPTSGRVRVLLGLIKEER